MASSVGDLAGVLRSHGNTPDPRYSALNGAMSAPCLHGGGLVTSSQTTSSWIADLRGSTPQHWATATSAPCTSIFKPVTVDQPVDLGPRPANTDDPSTLWWRHERLHRRALRDPGALIPRFRAERDRTERGWFTDPPSSASAFLAADRLERRWLDDVVDGPDDDVRPAWVRRQWQRWDRAAGLPAGGVTVVSGPAVGERREAEVSAAGRPA